MKKLLCTALLLASCLTVSFGQCDKELKLSTSKTEYLDGSGTVTKTVEENSIIEIGKSEIVIRPGNADHKMNGRIQSATCTWNTPYKEGKSVIKALFTDPSGDQKNATMTIEGKEGKVTFLMEIAELPERKIRVSVDSFEEKKI
ncbi:hypothetical protein [Larkinella soli]|uniref:hypothetical protein n=1 Tax=Larkinella soli TaxID=1770527 RepID=UPI000FFB2EE3|nr:hypothetical protein [Larkinella soli]